MPAIPALPPAFRLALEPDLTPALGRRVLAACGSAAAVYASSVTRLAAVLGTPLALQMAAPAGAELQRRWAAVQAWLALPGRSGLAWDDAGYPALLRQLSDPPLLLYVVGDPAALSRPALAVVGARRATAGGRDNAQAFARRLAAEGWCVVSGLAAGIDAAAHQGALAAGTGGGGTLAVLGTGADRIYPARHAALAEAIVAAGGALVSELPLGTPPLPAHFPRRNRLVAGLSRGVLVVEAALQSGSLITARLAADMGREVFAMPGSIHAPLSRGCHALIRQGAKLTESLDDLREELAAHGWPRAPAAGEGGGRGGVRRDVGGAAQGDVRGNARGDARDFRRAKAAADAATAADADVDAVADADADVDAGADAAALTDEAAAVRTRVHAVAVTDPEAGVDADAATAPVADRDQRRVLRVLGYDPVLVDDIQQRAGLAAAAVQAALLRLELAGRVRRAPGGRYERTSPDVAG